MKLYEKVLSNSEYLNTVKKIESLKFITDGKWDWEHGLGHYKRVAQYADIILSQLGADERTIDLGMTASLLHDIGLIKGNKIEHALESSKIFINFIAKNDITPAEENILREAIKDHSNGNNITSIIGLALVLADKLDVTYHRTINSSIKDTMNQEIQKIKEVDINITNDQLVVNYITDDDFNFTILKNWPKAITIHYKVSKYLNKNFEFLINKKAVDISNFIN